jgi:hypothetical protein
MWSKKQQQSVCFASDVFPKQIGRQQKAKLSSAIINVGGGKENR